MHGAAIVITASSFGTAIFQRAIGDKVRFASVRSSSSLPNAAAAIASTTSGAIEPASMPLSTTFSNSLTVGALFDRSMITEMITGIAASTVIIVRRHRPESWRSVRRYTGPMLLLHQVAEDAFERIVERLDAPQADARRLRETRQLDLQVLHVTTQHDDRAVGIDVYRVHRAEPDDLRRELARGVAEHADVIRPLVERRANRAELA